MKRLVMLAAVLAAAVGVSAETPTVTGTWNMGLQGDHVIPVALVLKQDGTKVTGTIAMPTNFCRVSVRDRWRPGSPLPLKRSFFRATSLASAS